MAGLVASVALLAGCQREQTAEAEKPKEVLSVTVAAPLVREVGEYEKFTGWTEAVESVEIRARVTGYLLRVAFQEGAEVKKSDLLFEIDPRPFQAKYNEAFSQVGLREADLKYRRAELARYKTLVAQKVKSQSDYDQVLAAHEQAVAAVAAAKASLEGVALDLSFTKVYAPISGQISRAQITPGNLVEADRTALTTIVSVDPMYVYFDADEYTMLRIEQEIREGKIKVRDPEQQRASVWMGLANDEGYPREGVINFAENRFDANTGTIRVRAVFDNPKGALSKRLLAPGMFTRLRVPLGEPRQAILVAERAVATDQGQKFLYVVNDRNEVEYRRVTLGQLEGRLRVISEGLKPGQRVIVTGLQRVRPGMIVAPKVVDMASYVEPGGPQTQPAESAGPATAGPGQPSKLPPAVAPAKPAAPQKAAVPEETKATKPVGPAIPDEATSPAAPAGKTPAGKTPAKP